MTLQEIVAQETLEVIGDLAMECTLSTARHGKGKEAVGKWVKIEGAVNSAAVDVVVPRDFHASHEGKKVEDVVRVSTLRQGK